MLTVFGSPVGATPCRPCHYYIRYTGERGRSPLRITHAIQHHQHHKLYIPIKFLWEEL